MKLKPEEIGFKLAAALLMHNREIAVSDLRAMPFFYPSPLFPNLARKQYEL